MSETRPLDPAALFDLYEALKDLTVWWDNWMPDNARTEGGKEALYKAQAALKRAEGRT